MGACSSAPKRQRDVLDSAEMPEVAETLVESIQSKKHDHTTLTRVNQYKFESLLGSGAYGAVYRAGPRCHRETRPARLRPHISRCCPQPMLPA